jgi:hypothetical protein
MVARSHRRMVACGLGVLLFTAAAAKTYGLAVSPVSPIGFFSQAWVQVAVIYLELTLNLGAWLLSGVAPVLALSAATFLFGCFAAITCYGGIVGQTSCGCLGKVEVNPWVAFTVDSLALALLLASMPRPRQWLQSVAAEARQLRSVGWAIVASAAVLGICIAGALFAIGSVDDALAFIRGEKVSVEPRFVDFGSGAVSESRLAQLAITNRLDSALKDLRGHVGLLLCSDQ